MARSAAQSVHDHLLAQVSRRSPQPKVSHPSHFALCKIAYLYYLNVLFLFFPFHLACLRYPDALLLDL